MTCGRSRTCTSEAPWEPRPGVNATDRLNVHSIAIQVPISAVTRSGHPTIGVWTNGQPPAGPGLGWKGQNVDSGLFGRCPGSATRCSTRSSTAMGEKTCGTRCRRRTTSSSPATSPTPVWRRYRSCTPACSPAGHAGGGQEAARRLGGDPAHRHTHGDHLRIPPTTPGSVLADMLRLNTSIAPAKAPNILGLIGGDLAGFPNGRRVMDDVRDDRDCRPSPGSRPAYRQGLQARRRRSRSHRWADALQRLRLVPQPVPLPRGSLRRLPQPVLRTASAGALRRGHGSPGRAGRLRFGVAVVRDAVMRSTLD